MRELINTIAHIGYQVSDLTRSLAFYEPLGFQRQQRFSKPSPQGAIEVAFLEMGAPFLSCTSCPGTPFDAPRCGIDHLALEVSDLDAVQSGWRRSAIRSMKGRLRKKMCASCLFAAPTANGSSSMPLSAKRQG
jgi:hypothetical protein